MLICVQTREGPRKVRVCDYCKTVCCTGRYCSGRCAGQAAEQALIESQKLRPSWASVRREPIKESTTEEILLDMAACLCLIDAEGRP